MNNNLKPLNERTKDEQREIARAGGKASGEARREKRDVRRALEMLLENEITDNDGKVRSGAEAIALKQFNKALQGDTKAFEVVCDRSGQQITQKFEVGRIDREQSLRELQEIFESD